jgi:hypothetical protein
MLGRPGHLGRECQGGLSETAGGVSDGGLLDERSFLGPVLRRGESGPSRDQPPDVRSS